MNEARLYFILLLGAFRTMMNSFSQFGEILIVKLFTRSLFIGFSINQDDNVYSELGIVVPS